MDAFLVGLCLIAAIAIYFAYNPMEHGTWFLVRRFFNWFPLGMSYAFLYMGRYNLNVAKNALGAGMSKADFGIIFGVGTLVYALSFLINGPLVDKIGGKKGMIIATIGAATANALMGVATYLFVMGHLGSHLLVIFCALYGLNMYFQSYGAVSIIKVKAYWFHVRERGIFGAIFGTLISFGLYFAFDWGQAIVEAFKSKPGELGLVQQWLRVAFATSDSGVDQTWFVFFIPAALLLLWAAIDAWAIKDTPKEANFDDFDTADASSGEMDKEFSKLDLIKRIFTNPVLLVAASVEFTAGILRNGILQWYPIFAKEVPTPGSTFFLTHWGLFTCIFGIFGGFLGGWLSDRVFQSRRGPPAVIMNAAMFVMTIVMAIFLFNAPFVVGAMASMMCLAVIGVHSLMSGTAGPDFGGRKATATAAGILDGFVYLGSTVQSISLGYLTSSSIGWQAWPIFLIPFAALGCVLALRIWKALPEATKRYLKEKEKIDLDAANAAAGIVSPSPSDA